jgi:hypothetical protein
MYIRALPCRSPDERQRNPGPPFKLEDRPRISLRSSGLQTKEAERRKAHPSMSARRDQVLSPEGALGAEAARCRGPLAFRRSTAALARATERSNSARAALRAKERTQALPAPSIALKRSTPRPGHSAGGDDARTARERGYKPRPQEPHSLHRSAVAGDVPSMSETRNPVT